MTGSLASSIVWRTIDSISSVTDLLDSLTSSNLAIDFNLFLIVAADAMDVSNEIVNIGPIFLNAIFSEFKKSEILSESSPEKESSLIICFASVILDSVMCCITVFVTSKRSSIKACRIEL